MLCARSGIQHGLGDIIHAGIGHIQQQGTDLFRNRTAARLTAAANGIAAIPKRFFYRIGLGGFSAAIQPFHGDKIAVPLGDEAQEHCGQGIYCRRDMCGLRALQFVRLAKTIAHGNAVNARLIRPLNIAATVADHHGMLIGYAP